MEFELILDKPLTLLEDADSDDGVLRFKAPVIQENTRTQRGTVYSSKCLDHWHDDVGSLLEQDESDPGSTDVLTMFASHRPEQSPSNFDPTLNTVGRITGRFIEEPEGGGPRVGWVEGEVYDTTNGKDVQKLLRHRAIRGVSLRGNAVESRKERFDGQPSIIVDRMKFKGTDFCRKRSMQYTGKNKGAKITLLESVDSGDEPVATLQQGDGSMELKDIKTLADLQAHDSGLYAVLLESAREEVNGEQEIADLRAKAARVDELEEKIETLEGEKASLLESDESKGDEVKTLQLRVGELEAEVESQGNLLESAERKVRKGDIREVIVGKVSELTDIEGNRAILLEGVDEAIDGAFDKLSVDADGKLLESSERPDDDAIADAVFSPISEIAKKALSWKAKGEVSPDTQGKLLESDETRKNRENHTEDEPEKPQATSVVEGIVGTIPK